MTNPVPNTYDVGDIVRLTCSFFLDEEMTIPAAPSAVALTIRDPFGDVVTPSVSPAAVATHDYELLVGGMHEIRWVGTGVVQAAEQERIFVRRVNTA